MKKRIPSNRANFLAKRTSSDRVARILSENYFVLKRRLGVGPGGNYLSMSYEDMFHNAILHVIQDTKAAHLPTDSQILKYFEYRYRCIVTEIIKDSQLVTHITYADNQQTKENPQE